MQRSPTGELQFVKHSFKLLPFNAIPGTLPLALEPKDNVCTSLYLEIWSLCSVVAWRRRLAATHPDRVEIRNEDESLCRGVALGVTRPLIVTSTLRKSVAVGQSQ